MDSRSDHEHELTAKRQPTRSGRICEIPQRSSDDLLVDLRQLAADRYRAVLVTRRSKVAERRRHPVRRLENHRGPIVGGDPPEPITALAP